MKLIITIDTEEDQWGNFQAHGHSVENTRNIPKLQALFDEFEIRPTYLINYPVATDPEAIEILTSIVSGGGCEIGSHCHPWNTPPYEEETNEKNSMLRNLPPDLQYKKIKVLHETIKKNLGVTPVSFRSGRWGYSDSVAKNLIKLGYEVDTSITPYISWKEYYGTDYSYIAPEPFRYGWNGDDHGSEKSLLHIPATVGYLRTNFDLSNAVYQFISNSKLKKFKVLGLLSKLNLVKRVILSPEMDEVSDMIALTKVMKAKGYSYVNLYFHSTTLKVGATEYVRTRSDEEKFYRKIRAYLEFIKTEGIASIKLADMKNLSELENIRSSNQMPI